jgi:hypothetical protein
MKHISLLIILIALVVVGASCGAAVTGSGNLVTREFDFSDFDTVAISHAFDGTITRGDSYRVAVTLDDNLEQYLDVQQDGGQVSIGLNETLAIGRSTLQFEMTLPALVAVSASGASRVALNGFSSSEVFTADASGASRITGEVTTGDATLTASGASTISLSGEVGAVRANASGASTIDLEQVTAASAQVDAGGASTVTVNTSGNLDANASGGSNVYYIGEPTMGNVETSGGGSVEAR